MKRKTKDLAKQQFYKFDKWILLEDKLKKLSPTAKLLYMVLRDREEISLKNAKAFTDKEGNLFQYFDQEKAASLIGVSLSAIKKAFKDLQEYKLIESVRQGLGKPNRLYILDFEISQDTLKELEYEKDEQENKKADTSAKVPTIKDIPNNSIYKNNKNMQENKKRKNWENNYKPKTRFHNINQSFNKYEEDELEKMLLESQKGKFDNTIDFENKFK